VTRELNESDETEQVHVQLRLAGAARASDHPLRRIREISDAALKSLSREFDRLYSKVGRPSIARRGCCERSFCSTSTVSRSDAPDEPLTTPPFRCSWPEHGRSGLGREHIQQNRERFLPRHANAFSSRTRAGQVWDLTRMSIQHPHLIELASQKSASCLLRTASSPIPTDFKGSPGRTNTTHPRRIGCALYRKGMGRNRTLYLACGHGEHATVSSWGVTHLGRRLRRTSAGRPDAPPRAQATE